MLVNVIEVILRYMKVDCTKDNNFHHWKKARPCMIGKLTEVRVFCFLFISFSSTFKGNLEVDLNK